MRDCMTSDDEHRAQALADLRKFVTDHGRVPTVREWDTLKLRPSRPTIRRVYDGWTAFIRAAGHAPIREGKPTADFDLDEIIERLRAGETLKSLAAEIGRTPPVLRERCDRYLRLTGEPPLNLPRGSHPRRRRPYQDRTYRA